MEERGEHALAVVDVREGENDESVNSYTYSIV